MPPRLFPSSAAIFLKRAIGPITVVMRWVGVGGLRINSRFHTMFDGPQHAEKREPAPGNIIAIRFKSHGWMQHCFLAFLGVEEFSQGGSRTVADHPSSAKKQISIMLVYCPNTLHSFTLSDSCNTTE